MDDSYIKQVAAAVASPENLRQARRDRQANRAIAALLGLAFMAAMLSKLVLSLIAAARPADDDLLLRSELEVVGSKWVQADPTEDSRPLQTYVIEPPDILGIDAVKLVPKAPYHIEALDVVQISVTGTLANQPIGGEFLIDVQGNVDLGPVYRKVNVLNQTIDEAQETIESHLRCTIEAPAVSVSLGQTARQQQISGEHLVRPDGTINLGTYGSVYVTGLTVAETKLVVEDQLKNYFHAPRVSVNVYAFNSKVYYVIIDGAGQGDSLVRIPIAGNETVMDALAQVNGLRAISSKNIWIARPAPGGVNCDQILLVSLVGIIHGTSATNYQVLPGDRVYIAGDMVGPLGNCIDQIMQAFERAFGPPLLSAHNIQVLNTPPSTIANPLLSGPVAP